MRITPWMMLSTAVTGGVHGASLSHVCSTSYIQAALPSDDTLPGVTIDASSVIAAATYNASMTGNVMYPDTGPFDYCNVTFAYSHNGRNDRVLVTYWMPPPSKFQGRFLATGGGGLAINSGNDSIAGGMAYGAAAGLTDGGFGSFDQQWDAVFLLANNTVNWESVHMFGYQAVHEMTILGKAFTTNFYQANSTKLYTYWQGCSEGGREGMSQVQRFAETYDGAIIGAPAIRYSFLQPNQLSQNIQQQTLNYFPPTCELERIVNATLEFCDSLDGKTDGVVSRTDLCALHFDINSTVGLSYSCPPSAGTPSLGIDPTPAQNGTVTQQGAQVAWTALQGLKDSQGRQVYIPYQYGTPFLDGSTKYNNATQTWSVGQSAYGGEWIERYLHLQNATYLPTLENITYDTLRDWFIAGYHIYGPTLQTTWPDLRPWASAPNKKILHYHGESDERIPPASSVRYWNSVRSYLYPELSYNASAAEMSVWYKFYMVPGGAHCANNPAEANGPWPQTNLAVMIDWVEKGVEPGKLNATHLGGEWKGRQAEICAWPLRPVWRGSDYNDNNNGTSMECVYDQTSLDTWHYDLDAYEFEIY